MSRLILASASPRRAELLAQINVQFTVDAADIDEQPRLGETPQDYVLRMAIEKALVVSSRHPGKTVLASDTSVVFGNEILGKPENEQHAKNMLRSLSGQTHQVMTSVCLLGQTQIESLNITEVTFRHLSDADIDDYWASGEPQGKAGSYAIQGFAATFIEKIVGSYSSVMGLPLFELGQMLAKEGLLKNI